MINIRIFSGYVGEKKKVTVEAYVLIPDYEVICILMTLESMSRKVKAQPVNTLAVVVSDIMNTKC